MKRLQQLILIFLLAILGSPAWAAITSVGTLGTGNSTTSNGSSLTMGIFDSGYEQ